MFSTYRLTPYSSLKFTFTCTRTVSPACSCCPVSFSKYDFRLKYFQLQIIALVCATSLPPLLWLSSR